jgi:hypothetical protein
MHNQRADRCKIRIIVIENDSIVFLTQLIIPLIRMTHIFKGNLMQLIKTLFNA